VRVAELISGLGQQEQDWRLLRPTVGHDRTSPELHVRFRYADSQVFTPNVAQIVLWVLTQRRMFEPTFRNELQLTCIIIP
jgi:hypothetical protein